MDYGSKFIAKVMEKWAYEHGVELDVNWPGQRTDNAKVESFNGRYWQECLNAHWFLSLDEANAQIEEWRHYDNETRPHSALKWATPSKFACQARKTGNSDVSIARENSTLDRY